jgi:hypothetical protein
MQKGFIGVMALCAALGVSGQALAQEQAPSGEQAQNQAPEQAPPQVDTQAQVQGQVARSAFTSDISEREPVDNLTTLTPDIARVYFFTELRNLEGQTVTHRWEHAGQVVAEIPFNVGGPRWRVWSSKNLDSGTTGEWSVTVVDGAGNELARESIAPAPQ